MKKYICIIVAILACIIFNSCGTPDTVKVEAGDGTLVPVEIYALTFGTNAFDYMKKSDIQPFVQEQCNILRRMCNNPRTFVPTSVGYFEIEDTINVDCDGETLTIYKYSCDVRGYAKNGFGVEGDVHLYLGVDKLDEPRFVIKNDFSGYEPYYYIGQYAIDSDDYVKIPFTYNGVTYYISTINRTAKEFCLEVNKG